MRSRLVNRCGDLVSRLSVTDPAGASRKTLVQRQLSRPNRQTRIYSCGSSSTSTSSSTSITAEFERLASIRESSFASTF